MKKNIINHMKKIIINHMKKIKINNMKKNIKLNINYLYN